MPGGSGTRSSNMRRVRQIQQTLKLNLDNDFQSCDAEMFSVSPPLPWN
jgi:hypothetical protein